MTTTSTRRSFLVTAGATASGLMIVPRHVLGRGWQAPSDLVNVAVVGVSGMGAVNLQGVMSENVVALCDCDLGLLDTKIGQWQKAAAAPPSDRPAPPRPAPGESVQGFTYWGPSAAQRAADARWPARDDRANLQRFVSGGLPRAARYQDYREMLEKQKDLDAVIVATPDHMHAVIASNAMDAGKHVYVQKPMCWSVAEARHLARQARERKVVAQHGNQRHSGDENRRSIEYLRAGAIGDVREVHVWTDRPNGWWPQGVPRPAASAAPRDTQWDDKALNARVAAALLGSHRVPDRLAWDLFLGVAPQVEYHPIYHPFNWRGWVDWGQGALGDMGAHLVDFPVWGLDLPLPAVVETESTPFNGASYPAATTTHYEFRTKAGLVRMTWYDGGLMPPDPEELEGGRLNPGGGILYVGSKGKLLHDGPTARLLPASRHNAYGAPKETLDRVPHQDHEMNWINTIKGKDRISSDFDYGARLTEIMLLGIVSLRARARLQYDAAAMRVTNDDAANEFLSRPYRAGYSL